MFNLLILAMLDIKRSGPPLSALAHQGHVLTAAFGALLLGLVAISILVSDLTPTIGWIGRYSRIFLILYVAAMRIVFRFERARAAGFVSDVVEGLQYGHLPERSAYAWFAAHALVIVAAATYLPHLGDEIATQPQTRCRSQPGVASDPGGSSTGDHVFIIKKSGRNQDTMWTRQAC